MPPSLAETIGLFSHDRERDFRRVPVYGRLIQSDSKEYVKDPFGALWVFVQGRAYTSKLLLRIVSNVVGAVPLRGLEIFLRIILGGQYLILREGDFQLNAVLFGCVCCTSVVRFHSIPPLSKQC